MLGNSRVAGSILLAFVLGACGLPPTTPAAAPPKTSASSPPTSEKLYEPTTPPVSPAGCLDNGVTVESGIVEAALGHRALVLTLSNCGTAPRTLTGYPEVRLLDKEKRPLNIQIDHGSSYMAIDPGPRPQTVKPGAKLLSVVSWANTVTDGDPTTGRYLTVAALTGEPLQTITVETDLGTTGKLTLTAWNPKLKN